MYPFILSPVWTSLDELVKQVELMHRQKRADGFIILYSEKNDPVKSYLLKEKVPFVVIGAAGDTKDKVTYIDNDNKALGKEAVTYLSSHGHKKIGFITDDLFGQVGQERYRGYKEAADELELEILAEVEQGYGIDMIELEIPVPRFSAIGMTIATAAP